MFWGPSLVLQLQPLTSSESVLSARTTLPLCVVSFTFTSVYRFETDTFDCFSFVWNPTSLVHNRVRTNCDLVFSILWAVSNAVLMFSVAMPLVARHFISWVFVLNTEHLRSWSTSFWTSSLKCPYLCWEKVHTVCLLWPRQTWQRSHQQRGYGLYVKHHLSQAVFDLVIPIRPHATFPTVFTCSSAMSVLTWLNTLCVVFTTRFPSMKCWCTSGWETAYIVPPSHIGCMVAVSKPRQYGQKSIFMRSARMEVCPVCTVSSSGFIMQLENPAHHCHWMTARDAQIVFEGIGHKGFGPPPILGNGATLLTKVFPV